MMFKIEHYTYRITWSPADGEFVGLVAEFPSLSWLAPTQVLALEGIQKCVSGVVKNLKRSGETIPRPLADREYSGEFKVRIPSQIHRALVIEAAEENVSLNRLVSSKLAR